MIEIKQNRRCFLKSAAGLTLTIPSMTSLLSHAQSSVAVTPRLVTMNMSMGGLTQSNWFPKNDNFGSEIPLYAGEGHTIRESPIRLNSSGGVSSIFDSKFAKYTDSMNMYKGLDFMFDMFHHGGYLGNFKRAGVGPYRDVLEAYPTIDSVVARFRDNSVPVPQMQFTSQAWNISHYSHDWSGDVKNPSSVGQPKTPKLDTLFGQLFTGTSEVVQPLDQDKILAVDSVLESFNRVVNGTFGDANRISAEDKIRLEEHMEKMYEIQRRVNEQIVGCSRDVNIDNFDTVDSRFVRGENTGGLVDHRVNWQVFTDMIAEAFSCDSNRVAIIHSHWGGREYGNGQYHDDFSHRMHEVAASQQVGISYKKYTMDNLLYPLLEKLSAKRDVDGKTILENSVVCMFDESGTQSHFNDSTPVATFGSANGYFNTGKLVDYRHLSENYRNKKYYNYDGHYQIRHGIPWNRFLATLLQSMGVGPNIWERSSHKGYGVDYIEGSHSHGITPLASHGDYRNCYEYQLGDMSNPLPLVT